MSIQTKAKLAVLFVLVAAVSFLLGREEHSGGFERPRSAVAALHPVFPSTIDTNADVALHLALLTKVRNVRGAVTRNLFEFVSLAAPDIHPALQPTAPLIPIAPAVPTPAAPQATTAAPMLPLIFYGDVSKRGSSHRAFLLDGDQIHITREGDVIEDRYRLTHIDLNSVTIEDVLTGTRHTLPLLQTDTHGA